MDDDHIVVVVRDELVKFENRFGDKMDSILSSLNSTVQSNRDNVRELSLCIKGNGVKGLVQRQSEIEDKTSGLKDEILQNREELLRKLEEHRREVNEGLRSPVVPSRQIDRSWIKDNFRWLLGLILLVILSSAGGMTLYEKISVIKSVIVP